VTSDYDVTVTADTSQDAADIARRRANEDGFRVRTTKRVVRVGGDPHRSRSWAVTLAVVPL
jgi:hypothetical protein